jgi:hypothetical protein
MKIHKTQDEYPRLTPLFGRCTGCKSVLPYPPVQVPTSIKATDRHSKWTIKWQRYCFKCAPRAIKNLGKDAKSMVPDKAWDPEFGYPVDNPFKKEINR